MRELLTPRLFSKRVRRAERAISRTWGFQPRFEQLEERLVLAAPTISGLSALTVALEGQAYTTTVSFTDPDGPSDTFTATIDWGDGATSVVSGVTSGQNYSHAYADGPSVFSQTVAISDSGGESSTALTRSVNVNNLSPTISGLSGLTVAFEGSIYLTSVSFTDPAVANDTYTATINWGDGAVSVVPGVTSGQNYGHAYADGPNVYSQTILITDSDGASSTALTRSVDVNNVPPNFSGQGIALASTVVSEGSDATATLTFIDTAGANDTITATIRWGDSTISVYSDVTSGQAFTHAYVDGPINRTVTAQLRDSDNSLSSNVVATVTVQNAIPVIAPPTFSSTSINEADSATMTFSFTDAGINDTHVATINWGDGTAADVISPAVAGAPITRTHQYVDNRTPTNTPYTVTITAQDNNGGTGTNSATINVANAPPTISTWTAVPNVNEGSDATVTLAFGDPAGTNDTYTATVDWGDSAASVYTGVTSGQLFTHTYADGPLPYAIKGKVSDEDGGTSPEATTSINVNNRPPTISGLSGLTVAFEGQTFTTTVSFADPAGPNDTYTATINWGDGAISVVPGVTSGQSYGHAYADGPSTFLQTVLITDSDGASSTALTRSIDVNNVAPNFTGQGIVLSSPTVNEGSDATATLTFRDDGGLNDTYTATINWGDSPASVYTNISSGQAFTHTYADGPTTRTITAQLRDSDNSLSSNVLATVTVQNAIPVIAPPTFSSTSINEADSATMTFSFTDAGINDTHVATINWGDGTAADVISPAVAGTPITRTHQYLDNRTPTSVPYTVTITAQDNNGGTGTNSATISVANLAPSISTWTAAPSVNEGSDATVTLAFNDSAGTNDTYTATIDWGDSSPSIYPSVTSGQVFTHTFADGPLSYAVKGKVSDEDGGTSLERTTSVSVINQAPTISLLTAPTNVNEGSAASVTVNFSDPAGVNDTYTATISWGDGATSVVASVTSGQTYLHTYPNVNNVNNYTISATISDSDSATSSASTASISVAGSPTIDLSLTGSPLAENGGTSTVVATLGSTWSQVVTVGLLFSGGASFNSDYSASGVNITIPAGSLTGSVTLSSINDTTFEGDETFVVDIGSVTNGAENGTQQVTANIVDDDNAPSVTLALIASPLAENAGVATVTAKLSNPSTQDVTIDLGFTGTASISGYSTSATSIVITAGNTSGSVTITGIDDATFEGNETVVVDVTGVTNGTENGTQQVTATIEDDENAPRVTLALAGSPLVENGGVATVTATLSNPSTQDVTINLGFAGTAVSSDYSASGTSIVIAAGNTSGSITLTGIDDLVSETTESVRVDITSVVGGQENGIQQSVLSILDDDRYIVSGNQLTITGTPKIDILTFRLDVGSLATAFEDETRLNPGVTSATVVNFGSEDIIKIVGRNGTVENATLSGSLLSFSSGGFTITANGNGAYYLFGQSEDSITLIDTTGDDVLYALPTHVIMQPVSGVGFIDQAIGYGTVTVQSPNGGVDVALFYDSPGNDTYTSSPSQASLAGVGFSSTVQNFESNYAFAIAGGNDSAILNDTSADDLFSALPAYATMDGGGKFSEAIGFDSVIGIATTGSDTANFYDSVGDDTYASSPTQATFNGPGFAHTAQGFDANYAISSMGGNDIATLNDSAGDDIFYGQLAYSALLAGNSLSEPVNFNQVTVIGSGGNDLAYLYDSAGNDTLVASGNQAQLSWGLGHSAIMQAFDTVYAVSSQGGADEELITPPLGFLLQSFGPWL